MLAPASRNKVSRWLAGASVVAFLVSLALPAYQTNRYGHLHNHSGLEAFILGPIGLFAGHISWAANAVLVLSLAKRTSPHYGLSFVLALLASVLACTFLLGKSIAVGDVGEFPYSASWGFYVWLLSMSLAAAAACTYPQTGESDGSSQNNVL